MLKKVKIIVHFFTNTGSGKTAAKTPATMLPGFLLYVVAPAAGNIVVLLAY